jgi:hypothetical protein
MIVLRGIFVCQAERFEGILNYILSFLIIYFGNSINGF